MGRTLETTRHIAEAKRLGRLAKKRRRWVTFAWKNRQLWFRRKAIVAVTLSPDNPCFTYIWLSGANEPFRTDELLSTVLKKLGLEEKENER